MTVISIDHSQTIASSDTRLLGYVAFIALPERDSALRKPLLFLSMLTSLLMAQSANVLALNTGGPANAYMQRNGSPAPLFGGAYSPTQNGKRPGDLRRPSSTMCALQGKTLSATSTTRQDASGKLHLFNDPSSLKSRNGNIYGNCGSGGGTGSGLIRGTGVKMDNGMGMGAGIRPPTSAYNARTNTLKAATDGYVNRSASSALMPKKAPSMYDPVTGVLKPSKSLNPYQIYQR